MLFLLSHWKWCKASNDDLFYKIEIESLGKIPQKYEIVGTFVQPEKIVSQMER